MRTQTRPRAPGELAGQHVDRRSLLVLAAATFVYVTAETVPIGLLPQIADGLHVSQADVGLLLTTYAGVAALSGVPLTALTMRLPRGLLIASLVVVFAVSQAAAALATSFVVLVVARLLCALAHGVFWSVLAPAVARLVPAGRTGKATSFVFTGNLVAMVLGVPLATALGQWLGWRAAFAALAVLGALAAGSLLAVLPALPALPQDLSATLRTRLRGAVAVLATPAVAGLCGVTAVVVIAHFAAYTYLAPVVFASGGLSGGSLTLLLLGYGTLGLAGNLVAGQLVDRFAHRVLLSSVLTIALGLVVLTVAGGRAGTVLGVLVWGAGFGALPVTLQSLCLRVAPGARDAASAVYVVAFQIGIGGGALVGDRLVVSGHLGALPVLGAVLAVAGAALVVTTGVTGRRRRPAGG